MHHVTTAHQSTPHQFAAAARNTSAPTVVTAAKVIAIVQAGLLLTLGGVLVIGGLTGLGIASIVEGGLRLGLAVALRRGARRTRMALLVLCVIGVGVGFMAGGLSMIGALINMAIARCLLHDDAKAYCNA